MKIRKASINDIDQIREFTRNTFPWGDYVPNAISKWINDGTAYAAVEGDLVLGVMNAVPLPTGVLWLEGIRVRSECRRRGVGRALTEFVMNEGRNQGMKYAMLMIAEWNEPSHNLAKSLGFKPILKLWTGIAEPTNPRRAEPMEHEKIIREALRRTGGYVCQDWRCTRATPEYVMSTVREIYIGPGIALGNFSIGPPTTPKEQEVLATEPGQFKNNYGTFIVYETEL